MVKNALKSEKTLLVTVLLIFELSYLFRCMTDINSSDMEKKKDFFQLLMLSFIFLFAASINCECKGYGGQMAEDEA